MAQAKPCPQVTFVNSPADEAPTTMVLGNSFRIAEYLDGRVKQRELVIDDCQHAAMQFMLMCQASLFLPFIYQAAPAPSQEQITRVVNDAVRTFLAAHAVRAI
jgi:hypothetical protein